MEIKTKQSIYLEGLNIIEANKNTGYSDETTRLRKEFEKKRVVDVDELIKCIDDIYNDLDMGKTIPIFIQRLKETLLEEKH